MSSPVKSSKNEEKPQIYARTAGVIGIIVLITGSFAGYANSRLIVSGDASTTAKNVIASEALFRLGFVSGLLMEIVFILYAFLLYWLLKPVDKKQALLMLILALIPVPLFLLNQLNHFAVLLASANQLFAQVSFYLDLHKHGGAIAAVFFGLWLFPLGLLVFRSGFFPRILGIFLMIGCFGYLLLFLQTFLLPSLSASLWTNPALVVTHVSELAMMLWLLIKGVNVEQWKKHSLSNS